MGDAATDRFLKALEQSAPAYQIHLPGDALRRLGSYFSLVQKWNERLHLVGPCSPEEFATRHVLESLLLVHYLPPNSAVTDVGSGAGLPLLPCLIIRPDLRATLIESSQKKAVFLREALRETQLSSQAIISNQRFEELPPPEGIITCRALDRFQQLLPELVEWAPKDGTLLLFGGQALQSKLDELRLIHTAALIPNSSNRFLIKVVCS